MQHEDFLVSSGNLLGLIEYRKVGGSFFFFFGSLYDSDCSWNLLMLLVLEMTEAMNIGIWRTCTVHIWNSSMCPTTHLYWQGPLRISLYEWACLLDPIIHTSLGVGANYFLVDSIVHIYSWVGPMGEDANIVIWAGPKFTHVHGGDAHIIGWVPTMHTTLGGG